MPRARSLIWILAGCRLGLTPLSSPAASGPASFQDFLSDYPLRPVHGYTFLGTEFSDEKPVVNYPGRIELWFDPTEHIPWLNRSIDAGTFAVELADGYLPVVKYQWRHPHLKQVCAMTAFAADAEPAGAIRLYVRLAESGSEETRVRHFRLRDLAPIDEKQFNEALQAVRERWESFFGQGKTIRCADPLLLNACKASLVRALITFRGKHPRYGVGVYSESIHEGFPPTMIALANGLLDWGHPQLAEEYLLAYFQRFVTPSGRFDYYGPSLAEYGQMLHLVRRLYDVTEDRAWLTAIRPKIERMRDWLWSAIDSSAGGLIAGAPEADTRKEVDVYFHNNAWCWRGLRDMAVVVDEQDNERCEQFRRKILEAVEQVMERNADPAFIPPVARKIAPWQTMTQDGFASYTNYRYWLELLSSGILTWPQASFIIEYRKMHQGEIAGMTRFMRHADNWPIAEYGFALLSWGQTQAAQEVLLGHLAGHSTPGTWTAYEQVSLNSNSFRHPIADYCVPAQLVGPRLLVAWLAAVCPDTRAKVPPAGGTLTVDGHLNESCYENTTPIDLARVAGAPEKRPPRTRAWLQWHPERLVFAFDAQDADLLTAPPSSNEREVDHQDRVELFLWSGKETDHYGCIEISASGARHDYQARFYRRFDDTWSPDGLSYAVERRPQGYSVEGTIPRAAVEALGLRLEPGARWRVGLFRADFAANHPEQPSWITWADAQGPHPDFHVPASFGELELLPFTP